MDLSQTALQLEVLLRKILQYKSFLFNSNLPHESFSRGKGDRMCVTGLIGVSATQVPAVVLIGCVDQSDRSLKPLAQKGERAIGQVLHTGIVGKL